ncbi:MAG: ion transporter [Lentisphaeria bacterium]|nr:ion transporter [Lentisphaeria bacterium]NQZ69969.1 ion transporter [Lentisphaeria bacterium]
MQEKIKKIAESSAFSIFIILVIILAGILVGIETYDSIAEKHHTLLHYLDKIILWIFVIEILIKMTAEGKQFWNYFKDPWNIFDFIIVAVCFMPVNAQYVAVLRLARILRILKLVTAVPKLQILVGALLKSIPSMVYVSILLSLLFYIYAVMATFMFKGNDPIHFGSLQQSMLSLFRVVTLEDWTDIMYIQMYGSDVYAYPDAETVMQISGMQNIPQAMPLFSAIFFVTFVLFGTMIIMNLFIGVIMTGMDEARNEERMRYQISMRERDEVSLEEEINIINEQLGDLQEHLKVLQRRLSPADKN